MSKSLLHQSEGDDQEPRFVMLETIREYANERLVEYQETEALQQRHATYYLSLAERFEREGPQLGSWLSKLAVEHDNLRAALMWHQMRGSSETVLQMAEALWGFWVKQGHITEGRSWMERALATSSQAATPVRGRALFGAGLLAYLQSNLEQATLRWNESLAMFRALEDKSWIGQSLLFLGSIADIQGDLGRAHALYEEGLELFRQQDDKLGMANAYQALGEHAESLAIVQERGDKSGIAYALSGLAHDTVVQGDLVRAAELFEESLALCRELGDTVTIAHVLNELGGVACAQGHYARARVLFQESSALSRDLNDHRISAETDVHLGQLALDEGDLILAGTLFRQSLVVFQKLKHTRWIDECMLDIAVLAHVQGRVLRATRLLGAAVTLREATHQKIPTWAGAVFANNLGTMHTQLHQTAFAAAWAEGRAMSLEQASAYALSDDD